ALAAAVTALSALAGAVPGLTAVPTPTDCPSLSSAAGTVGSDLTAIDAAISQLTVLDTLSAQLPNVTLGDLLSGTDLNSSALTEPTAVGTVHSRSATNLQDLSVGKLPAAVGGYVAGTQLL